MPKGRTHRIASATLSGLQPPCQQHAPPAAPAPRPPASWRSCPSRRAGSDRRRRSAARRGRGHWTVGESAVTGGHALITGNVIRGCRASSSSPWSCTSDNPARLAHAVHMAPTGWFTNTPTAQTDRGSAAPRSLSRATGSDETRAAWPEDESERSRPSATDASASSRRVMPQILTNIDAPTRPVRAVPARQPPAAAPPSRFRIVCQHEPLTNQECAVSDRAQMPEVGRGLRPLSLTATAPGGYPRHQLVREHGRPPRASAGCGC
mgnify:CR=1 FL=1